MPIVTGFCYSAKADFLAGRHNMMLSGGDTFKAALYTTAATLGVATTAYSATNEAAITNSGTGYSAGGGTLTRIDPAVNGTSGVADFADFTWTLTQVSGVPALTGAGILIYNDTLTTPVADASVSVHSFTEATASGNGATFQIVFPAATAGNAIIEIA